MNIKVLQIGNDFVKEIELPVSDDKFGTTLVDNIENMTNSGFYNFYVKPSFEYDLAVFYNDDLSEDDLTEKSFNKNAKKLFDQDEYGDIFICKYDDLSIYKERDINFSSVPEDFIERVKRILK